MSHTLTTSVLTPILVTLTIQNYTAGGETVLASEITSIAGITAVFFAQVPSGSNSLASVLFPVLSGGKIMLFRFSAGAFVEIPTTSALNAVVNAMVFVN